MRIALFDYGVGNLHSLGKALEAADPEVQLDICDSWDRALTADALVLPGVGAFGPAAAALPSDRSPLRSALGAGFPCLGICLGMQLLFDGSEEAPGEGIGAIPGQVRRLDAPRVPHMGWNSVEVVAPDPIFEDTPDPVVYYANSYICEPLSDEVTIGRTTYGEVTFVSAVRRKNVWGLQFHPEKSSSTGQRIIRNFVSTARAGVSS
jgi:glutamine amidotransferase